MTAAGMPRCAIFAAAAPLLIAHLPGCGVGLEPYDEVRAAQPADEFVELAGQWVHFVRTGAGEPLVLIHGFGGSTYSWRDVQPALAESYDVIALDLNGFGYTERPVAPGAYSLDAQEALVIRLLDHLGIDRVCLAGHSYGAGVALLLALDHPERVRSLILIDGGPADAASVLSLPSFLAPVYYCYTRLFLLTENGVERRLRSVVYNQSIITPEVVDEYLRRLRIGGLRHTFDGLLQQVNTPPRDVDVSKLVQPTLVIWGVHDPVFPLSTGRELADTIPGARLIELDGSGHLPMEEEPARFIQVVQEFLAGQ